MLKAAVSRFTAGFAAVVFMALVPPLLAQDGPQRTELRRSDLPGAGNTEVIMSELVLPPGASVPRHTHHGEEYLYVIEGGTVETANGEVMTLAPGMTLHYPRGKVHGGFTATGDAASKVVTVHIVDKGKPLYVPVD